jgi:hypothetical protein
MERGSLPRLHDEREWTKGLFNGDRNGRCSNYVDRVVKRNGGGWRSSTVDCFRRGQEDLVAGKDAAWTGGAREALSYVGGGERR